MGADCSGDYWEAQLVPSHRELPPTFWKLSVRRFLLDIPSHECYHDAEINTSYRIGFSLLGV
jgi:hypothetical protein